MKTKFLLTTVILFCIAFTANAQIDKGRYLLGGSFNFRSMKNIQPYYNNDYGYKSAFANIQIGKVVKENTIAGLIFAYSYSGQHPTNFPDSNFNKNNQYSAGVFCRRYKKLLNNFYFFGEVDGMYIYSKNSQGYLQDGSDEIKVISNGGSVSFVPGISYGICKSLQVELSMPNILSLSYLSSKVSYTTPTPINVNTTGDDFSLNANLNSNFLSNFGIGFKFLL